MTLRAFPMLNDLSDSLFADRFNRIDRLFSQLTGSTPLPSTPSYNIRRVGDNRYELTLSVPGWKESELEIETVGGQLNISGKREEEKTENGEEGWIHRGISRSDFRASYSLPEHVKSVIVEDISHVKLIDATPIGINVRSTVATYVNVHDELRKIYARTADAKKWKYKAGDFSYNTVKLRCPVCDGTGEISLDVQFLPDVDVPCPECGGSRYGKEAYQVYHENKKGQKISLPQMMAMDIHTALEVTEDLKTVHQRLEVLGKLGLGYLTLGEETPSLSGGEAQRLKLASEMGKGQADSVFVFDEPTIGLHPLDVRTLLQVFQTLIENGATVVIIEHDLDVIRNADYIIDMGPGGGEAGGRIVAAGTPEQIQKNPESITGRYI